MSGRTVKRKKNIDRSGPGMGGPSAMDRHGCRQEEGDGGNVPGTFRWSPILSDSRGEDEVRVGAAAAVEKNEKKRVCPILCP